MSSSYRTSLFIPYEEITAKTPKYSLRRHYSHLPTLWRENGNLSNLGPTVNDEDILPMKIQDSNKAEYSTNDPIYDDVYEPPKCSHPLFPQMSLEKSIGHEFPTYIKFDEPCPPAETVLPKYGSIMEDDEESFQHKHLEDYQDTRRGDTKKCSKNMDTRTQRRHFMFPVVSVAGSRSNRSSYSSPDQRSRANHGFNAPGHKSTRELNSMVSFEGDNNSLEIREAHVQYRNLPPVQNLEITENELQIRIEILENRTFQKTPFREANKMIRQRQSVHPITVPAGTYNPFEGVAFKSATFPRQKSAKSSTFERIRTTVVKAFHRLKVTKTYNLALNDKSENRRVDLLDYQGHPFSESPSKECKLKYQTGTSTLRKSLMIERRIL